MHFTNTPRHRFLILLFDDIFSGAELGQAISEAEGIVAEMELRNFEGQNDKVEVELEHAKELLEKMQNFFTPVKVCSIHFTGLATCVLL